LLLAAYVTLLCKLFELLSAVELSAIPRVTPHKSLSIVLTLELIRTDAL